MAAGFHLNLSGTADKAIMHGSATSGGHKLTNAGIITWTGTGNLLGGDGSVITNQSGGLFDIRNDSTLGDLNLGVDPTFTNQAGATLRKSTAIGATTIGSTVNFNTGGAIELLAGELITSNGYTQTAGATILNGGNLSAPAGSITIQAGSLTGVGTITGNVVNSGLVSPGASPGLLAITGTYRQNATGTLAIELGGLTPGTEFDRMTVTGVATLAGTLNVSLIDGFAPADGDLFTVLQYGSRSGDFTTLNATIPGGALIRTAGATEYTLTVSLTNQPPEALLLLSPGDATLVSPIPTFTMQATDPEGGQVKYVIEAQQGATTVTYETELTASDAAYTYDVPVDQPLAAGQWSWRAKAIDAQDLTGSWSAARTFTIPASQPALATTGGLSTLGLPFAPNTLTAPGMQLISWDPVAGQYVQVTELSQLQAGAGYWAQGALPSALRYVGQPVAPDTPAPLKAGWNLISLPAFSAAVWDITAITVQNGLETKTLTEAESAGWVSDFAWGWQQDTIDPGAGRYVLIYDTAIIPGVSNAVEPWKAYWMLANVDCAIVFPDQRARSGARAPVPGAWSVRIRGRTSRGGAEIVLGTTGMPNGRAVSQPPTSPGTGSAPQIILVRNNVPLAVDLLPASAGTLQWTFTVVPGTRARGEDLRLTWPDLKAVPGSMALILVDQATGARRYLRTTTHYIIPAARLTTAQQFTIIAERRQSSPLLISQLHVEPAPRGRGVPIAFTLSSSAQTDITVVTATGRRVRTVEQGVSRAAGINQALWDGRDQAGRQMPRGIYFLTVRATDAENRQVSAMIAVPVN
ncbi:MAG: FlgD immunoglobulin-like domain containing protein [Armatimonadota bacterium]